MLELKQRLWVFAIATCLMSGVAMAESFKVGFVNPADVLEKAPQADAARASLEKEFEPREEALREMQADIQSREEKLLRDSAVMSDSVRRKTEREIRSRQRELQRAKDDFREDFNLRRNEILAELNRTVAEAITAVAENKGYDLIFSDGVNYASKRVDITGRVLEALKEDFKRTNAAP